MNYLKGSDGKANVEIRKEGTNTCSQRWRLLVPVSWTPCTSFCCNAVWWRKTRIWRECSSQL